MKIDLKVPCSVDMSVINAQMAVVEQKKAELKEAIDALANSSVELLFSNVKPNAEQTPIPEAEQQPSEKTTLSAAFFKKASEVPTGTVIADLWRKWSTGEVLALLDEFFQIAFEVFCNSSIVQDNDNEPDIAVHPTANVPDYPEWRDLLKQNNAGILEAGDDYLDQQELDAALQQVYLLSKEFFQQQPKEVKFPSFDSFLKSGAKHYGSLALEQNEEGQYAKQMLMDAYNHLLHIIGAINK